MTLGLQVDSCMAKDMRTVAGTPCAFSAAWKAQRLSLQGAKTGESAAWVAERILSWSSESLGGFHPPEVRPQLRKFWEPLGWLSLAPLAPQLPELKPKRPAPDADDEEEEEDEAEDEEEDEPDLESLLPEDDACEFEFELDLDWLEASDWDWDCELESELEPD